jgi:hypothetical protein
VGDAQTLVGAAVEEQYGELVAADPGDSVGASS